ncbi:MAG: ATP-dependent DNA helicase [Deltaproteobacteria bacterium]|jgi:ATP-dependent DNA helicase RecQ|nr:ATP-dependent DNA helicase [Deltaproteobacteria bacterium]
MELLSELKRYLDLASFRPGQEEVISTVVEGHDAVVVMPTGGGKSLCYQLPALIREGTALVVSPLIALMKDQVDALCRKGVAAAYINSTLPRTEQKHVLERLLSKDLKLLYVAPERFRQKEFLHALSASCISFVAIDEAHCISQWGHDFRPDYLRLGKILKATGPYQILGATATATESVISDIILHLDLTNCRQFVTGFYRDNLQLSVVHSSSKREKEKRLTSLLSKKGLPAIVYCATRKNVDDIQEMLEGRGHTVSGYHAGMTDETRNRVQERFMTGRCPIIVATNAFGMGIDKLNIRQVVHYQFPGSIESYYQEIGRAGRDGKESECTLLFSFRDFFIQEFFIEMNYPPRDAVRDVFGFLKNTGKNYLSIKNNVIFDSIDSVQSAGQVGIIMKMLEQARFLERLYSGRRLCFVAAGKKRPKGPVREKIFDAVARIAGSEGKRVSIDGLAAAADRETPVLLRHLRLLAADGFITYISPHAGRDLRIILPEASFEDLDIDFEILEERKRNDIRKAKEMTAYGYYGGCRWDFLLSYFGDDSATDRCGSCDNCIRKEPKTTKADSKEEEMTILKILSCAARMEGRFGRARVAQVLSGASRKWVTSEGMNRLSTYGLLSDYTQEEVLELIDQLDRQGCFVRQGNQLYPTIALSEKGIRVMKKEENVFVNLPEARKPAKAAAEVVLDFSPEVYEMLRKKREELGAKEDIPLFLVASNRTLQEMASQLPSTMSELLHIHGIGPAKAQKYGQKFLNVISEYCKERGRNNLPK